MSIPLDSRDTNRKIEPKKCGSTPLAPSPKSTAQNEFLASSRKRVNVPDLALESTTGSQK